MVIAVVGNKCDLVDQAVVSTDQGESFARSFGAIFMRTSAKENMGVSELFEQICDELISKLNIAESTNDPKGKKLKSNNNVDKSGKPCCG